MDFSWGKYRTGIYYNGLNAMKGEIGEESIVLIHDGVRPLIDGELDYKEH